MKGTFCLRAIAECAAVFTVMAFFSNCTQKVSPGTAQNDILSMQRINPQKTVVTVRTETNIADSAMESSLEKQFPDVDFIFVQHCARETQYELKKSLESGDFEDIVLSPHLNTLNKTISGALYDLSGEKFVNSYNNQALASCAVGGKLYYLPGPSDVYGIVYDKTLFEAKGWAVPHSLSEFVSLCKIIDSSGIRAFQPTCRYPRQAQLLFTMFCYDSVFGGINSYEWLSDYQRGSVPMSSRLAPAFNVYKKLHELNLINPEDFDMEPGNRSIMMYSRHTCAMIVENQMAEQYGKTFHITDQSEIHKYGMMPFWCGDDPNSDHVMSYANYYIGINKNLAEKKNQKKLAAVLKAMEYISTPEGQLALSDGKMTMMSSVLNTPIESNEFNKEIQNTIKKGNAIPEPNLMSSGNGNPAEKALQQGLRLFLENKMTAEQVMSSCD